MSLSSDLQVLKTKLDQYFSMVLTSLKAKPPVVTKSTNALKLQGDNTAAMTTTVKAPVTTHENNKSNPHEVTPAQTGSYSTGEFDSLTANYIDSGVIPVSRYGTLSYLPPGVAGNFEGATTVKVIAGGPQNCREMFSMQMEDNGTLAFLRNGTDGSTQGVYYGYLMGAVSGLAGKKPIVTTRRYRPPFVPAGNSVAYLYQGGTGVIAGRFQDASNVLGQLFITLMNGTLNDAAHSSCAILPASFEPILNYSEVIVGTDRVYILYNPYAEQRSSAAGDPLDFWLYEVPFSAFGTGSQYTPTEVTMGQCTGFLGATYNTGRIRLAALAESKDATTPALVQHINGTNSGYHLGSRHLNASGKVMTLSAFNADKSKLRVLVYQDPRYYVSGSTLQGTKMNWSFVIDMSTKAVTLDAGLTPMTVEQKSGESVLTYGGTVWDPNGGTALMTSTGTDTSARAYITEAGQIYTSRVLYNPASFDAIYRGEWNAFTSVFDALKAPMGARLPNKREIVNCPLTYGSPVGDSYDGFRLIPGNQAVFMNRGGGASSTPTLVKVRLKPVGQDLSPNYTYSSLTYPAGLAGYKPTTERVNVDLSERQKLQMLIEEMDDTSYTVSGSVLSNIPGFESRYITLNQDLSTTGTISATKAQLETLRDQVLIAGGFDPALIPGEYFIELIIPRNANVPVYCNVMFAYNNLERRILMYTVNVNARTGALTSMTVGTQIMSVSLGNILNVFGCYFEAEGCFRVGTHIIYEVSDGWMICGQPSCRIAGPSSSLFGRYAFFVDKATKAISSIKAANTSVGIPQLRYGGLPGYGIGQFLTIDAAAKLIYNKMATNRTEFNTWVLDNEANAKVLVSQEVAQGWTVYFTEETPVIVNGVVGNLPVMNIDLTTIKANPANSTFYVYVQLVSGVATYVISATYQAETQTLLYIGTVVTGASSISSINIEKVTTFAGFRLADSAQGGSIPVSPGLPSRASNINPNWLA